jgi:hypothetical protein
MCIKVGMLTSSRVGMEWPSQKSDLDHSSCLLGMGSSRQQLRQAIHPAWASFGIQLLASNLLRPPCAC